MWDLVRMFADADADVRCITNIHTDQTRIRRLICGELRRLISEWWQNTCAWVRDKLKGGNISKFFENSFW